MKTTIGCLENLDFDGAEQITKALGRSNSEWTRESMSKQISSLLDSRRVVYDGPQKNMYFPRGSFLIKMQVPEVKDLKPVVLDKLGLDESQRLKTNQVYNSYYSMPIGLLVNTYPNDAMPNEISFDDPNVLDFGSHVFAFYVQRKPQLRPYFHVVDEEFRARYPNNNFKLD